MITEPSTIWITFISSSRFPTIINFSEWRKLAKFLNRMRSKHSVQIRRGETCAAWLAISHAAIEDFPFFYLNIYIGCVSVCVHHVYVCVCVCIWFQWWRCSMLYNGFHFWTDMHIMLRSMSMSIGCYNKSMPCLRLQLWRFTMRLKLTESTTLFFPKCFIIFPSLFFFFFVCVSNLFLAWLPPLMQYIQYVFDTIMGA